MGHRSAMQSVLGGGVSAKGMSDSSGMVWRKFATER